MNDVKFREFYVKPKLPSELEHLFEMAQNVWSTWDSDAYQLYSRIDPVLFRKFNHNPVKLLHSVSEKRLEELAHSKGFLYEMDSVYWKFRNYMNFPGDFHDEQGNKIEIDSEFNVAYFSMEYGLHESIPIYSGGLGILSGDHLKAASDSKLPLTGFGLLYKYGYFNQEIDELGKQKESYRENEWYSKPVKKVKDNNGSDLIFDIEISGRKFSILPWKINVGTVPLYLLDTNIPQNDDQIRRVTDHLYVSDRELRILQEIILAYGSIKLMEILNIKPTIYHLNEGHSAFLIIKRLEDMIKNEGFTFHEATELIRISTVFTTHTPVPAGNEKFPMELVKTYMKDKITSLGMSFEQFSELAKVKDDESFFMPALAIRFASFINGVSKLHSAVSKQMWHSIYPDLYEDEMPIDSITNGVHLQSWLSRQLTRLFDRYIGPDYTHMAYNKLVWKNIISIPDHEIWEAHQRRKEQMISFIRTRLSESLKHHGIAYSLEKPINNILNPNFLTVGFARRFATYKRANLIIRDKERLLKLINNPEQPIQFVFAGKAHPADETGKAIIKELIDFAKENSIEDRFVFVQNYDIDVARHLVQGVDVWLNNPIKPQEASGTSGMKAGINGVLNLSVLDGWWPECYDVYNGWSIVSGESVTDPDVRDRLEAAEIYDLLEHQLAKLFYDRDKNGLPIEWVRRMKQSMHDVGLGFNIHRMLREYNYKFYLRGHELIKLMRSNDYNSLKKIMSTSSNIYSNWNKINFIECNLDMPDSDSIDSGQEFEVKAKVYLAEADEKLFKVELFYKYNSVWETIPLEFANKNENNEAIYVGKFKVKGAGKQDFNFRITPITCKNCKNYYNLVKWYINP
ncbi:MAG: alpha-glucan family phosphorylase [Candidatus Cloacimonetes bacterium]|nr:alpha-glucan family phosphorylase [Candidatus Cloacimonadota bacterium]